MKAVNPFMKALLRSPLHGVISHQYMLITFTGRKSGRVYTTPVQYAQVGTTLYVITSENYTWWKNLRGGADVELRLRGRQVRGRANADTDPAAVSALVEQVYPRLNAERRARFVPGKVAITIALEGAA